MDTKLYQDYVAIKLELENLTQREKVAKEALMNSLIKAGKEKEENVFGKFTVAIRKTYEYSAKVEELNEKLKLQKHKEEEKGIATIKTNTPYLLWTPVK